MNPSEKALSTPEENTKQETAADQETEKPPGSKNAMLQKIATNINSDVQDLHKKEIATSVFIQEPLQTPKPEMNQFKKEEDTAVSTSETPPAQFQMIPTPWPSKNIITHFKPRSKVIVEFNAKVPLSLKKAIASESIPEKPIPECSPKKPKVLTLPEHIYPDCSVSLPSVPQELNTEDLSVFHSVWESDEGGSLDICPTKKPKLVHPKQNPDSNSFDVFVRNSDCLPIPYELAADYFPSTSASTSAFVEQTLQLTDPFNHLWSITYICFDAEEAFILTRNWDRYASTLNLQHMDTVRFMSPDARLGTNRFKTQHFHQPDSETVQIKFPQFLPKNFLFQMKFGMGDARLGIERLVIDAKQVRRYFPGIRKKLKQEMVKFTDYRDKDWFVKMVYTGIGDLYIVMDDVWEGFVKEHELRAGDQVHFYKPNVISHDKHFLIQFIKQKQGNAPTVLGTSSHGSDNDHNKQQSVAADQETVGGRPSVQSGGETSLKSSSNVQESLKTQIARCSSPKIPKLVTLPENIYPDDLVSLPSVPQELSAEDLSVLHSVWEFDGGGNLDEFLKQQQQAFQLMEEINKHSQKSAAGTSNQKKTTGENSFYNFSLHLFTAQLLENDTLLNKKYFYNFDDSCNPEDREGQQLVFQLKISDTDRLVIPDWMMSEEFPLLMIFPDGEEMLQLTDYRGEIWEVSLKYDHGLNSYLITNGWSTYLKHHHLKFMDFVLCYKDVSQKNPNHFLFVHKKKFGGSPFLFKVVIPRSNRLRIFFNQVAGHLNFPEAILPPNHLCENSIHVTDYLDVAWEMTLVRFEEEKAYVVVWGWEQYVAQHDLKHKDMISFYRQKHKTDSNSFQIYHELSSTPGSKNIEFELPPLFLPKNILFEVYLSKADFGSGSLMMPAVEIPSLCHFRNIVKLTDANNKDWFVIIEQMKKGYMIIDGWEGYMKEYKLEAGDMVRLYVPASANHDKHFLIEYGKIKDKRERERGFCCSSGNRSWVLV